MRCLADFFSLVFHWFGVVQGLLATYTKQPETVDALDEHTTLQLKIWINPNNPHPAANRPLDSACEPRRYNLPSDALCRTMIEGKEPPTYSSQNPRSA